MKKLADETEWRTRKVRIDPKLDARGWGLPPKGVRPLHAPFRSEEEPTDNGPADYALWADNEVAAIVEAKRITTGPQNVLTQAERYARGLRGSKRDYDGLGCPFLYSTNGEVVWFHDVRHPQSRSRRVADFHTPAALREMLAHDFEGACAKLPALPFHADLRDYQRKANTDIEQAIADHKRRLLVAMATGTGKTFTLVSEIYRLMKAGVVRRVLFLVDRRALAAQAVRAFATFQAEPGLKFDQIYEVYSSRFQRDDFGGRRDARPAEASSIRRAPHRVPHEPEGGGALRLRVHHPADGDQHPRPASGVWDVGEEPIDDDAGRLDIPIHAFDLIVADECHRGYTAQEVSTWRDTLAHFDAIQIGLTATPSSTTTSYFTHKVVDYSYEHAVREGYLVDYDVVNLRSEVRMNGLFLQAGRERRGGGPRDGAHANGPARGRARSTTRRRSRARSPPPTPTARSSPRSRSTRTRTSSSQAASPRR